MVVEGDLEIEMPSQSSNLFSGVCWNQRYQHGIICEEE